MLYFACIVMADDSASEEQQRARKKRGYAVATVGIISLVIMIAVASAASTENIPLHLSNVRHLTVITTASCATCTP